jgi:hypothetical protein
VPAPAGERYLAGVSGSAAGCSGQRVFTCAARVAQSARGLTIVMLAPPSVRVSTAAAQFGQLKHSTTPKDHTGPAVLVALRRSERPVFGQRDSPGGLTPGLSCTSLS